MKRVFLDTNILIDYIQARAGGDPVDISPEKKSCSFWEAKNTFINSFHQSS